MRNPCLDIYDNIMWGIDQRTWPVLGTEGMVKSTVELFNKRYETNFVYIGGDGISEMFVMNDQSVSETTRVIFLGVMHCAKTVGTQVTLVERAK